MNELPRSVRISKVVEESKNVKTLFLDTKINAKPGQFVMVWLPGVNEKPFSLSYIEKPAITIPSILNVINETPYKFNLVPRFKSKKGNLFRI